MEEFGIPKKLVALTKMCMEDTQYRIRVQQTMSEPFEISTGLKQGYSLSPTLFNLALEKTIKEMQMETTGITIGQQRIQVLGFADDLNILENSLVDTERAAQVLERAASKIGLKINMDKTKIMELLGEEEDNSDTGSLGEIGVRLVKAERAAFALNKFLKSKVFSKKTKARLYTAIIRPILTYGCEAWTTTSNTEKKLRTFENKISRVICGPVYDNEKGTWRRKYNKELQEEMEMTSVVSFMKGQRIQWLGHMWRRSEDDINRVILEWKPTGKRPRRRPRKRWLDGVEKDLHRMGVQDWKKLAQDRDKWRDLVMAVKTLKDY
ncbi:hypothetical protein QTP88_009380 [Uroleucon formosanum]